MRRDDGLLRRESEFKPMTIGESRLRPKDITKLSVTNIFRSSPAHNNDLNCIAATPNTGSKMPTQSDPKIAFSGTKGLQPWSVRSDYKAYRSPYGPAYQTSPNFHGINLRRGLGFGTLAGGFGAVAGIFALFFFAEVPRVRIDIMEKVPILGEYYRKSAEVPPEDNPF